MEQVSKEERAIEALRRAFDRARRLCPGLAPDLRRALGRSFGRRAPFEHGPAESRPPRIAIPSPAKRAAIRRLEECLPKGLTISRKERLAQDVWESYSMYRDERLRPRPGERLDEYTCRLGLDRSTLDPQHLEDLQASCDEAAEHGRAGRGRPQKAAEWIAVWFLASASKRATGRWPSWSGSAPGGGPFARLVRAWVAVLRKEERPDTDLSKVIRSVCEWERKQAEKWAEPARRRRKQGSRRAKRTRQLPG